MQASSGLPAKRVGKYELGAVIGKGSFSTVRLGVDTQTNQRYAVKVMAKEQLVRQQLEEKVRREVAVLKALRHTHIVQLHDVLQTASSVYLVLEYIEGGELFKAIVDNKRLPESQARRLFQQLILAMRYCHHQRVAHRDLKPENVLISATGDIKVNDFGLARLTDENNEMMTTKCGSPNYIAPEVIRDPRYNGFSADVWSCGIILYVMISGKHAFTDPNREGLFAKILRGEHRPFDVNFSDSVKDLLSKILVVDLESRYKISDILQHPWFLEGFDATQLPSTEKDIEVTQDDTDNAVHAANEDFAASDAAMPAGGGGDRRRFRYAGPGGVEGAATGVAAALKALGASPTGGVAADGATAQLRAFITSKSHGLITLVADVSNDGGAVVVAIAKARGNAAGFDDAVAGVVASFGDAMTVLPQ